MALSGASLAVSPSAAKVQQEMQLLASKKKKKKKKRINEFLTDFFLPPSYCLSGVARPCSISMHVLSH